MKAIIFDKHRKRHVQRAERNTCRLYFQPEVTGAGARHGAGAAGYAGAASAEKAKEPNIYVVKYPIRPGETRIDLSYSLPASAKFDGRILHGGGPVRIVAPTGVKLEGTGLTDLGNEPRTQAMIYEAEGNGPGVRGSGNGLAAGSAAAKAVRRDRPPRKITAPGIDQVKPRIYKRIEAVLALSLMMLAIGFVLLYRSDVRA